MWFKIMYVINTKQPNVMFKMNKLQTSIIQKLVPYAVMQTFAHH